MRTRHGFRYGAGYKLRSRYYVSTDLCVVRIQTARLDVIYRICNKISRMLRIPSITRSAATQGVIETCNCAHFQLQFTCNLSTNLHLVQFEVMGLETISSDCHRRGESRRPIDHPSLIMYATLNGNRSNRAADIFCSQFSCANLRSAGQQKLIQVRLRIFSQYLKCYNITIRQFKSPHYILALFLGAIEVNECINVALIN